MTFQTASGNFQPPATLMYGFKPMTESLPAAAARTTPIPSKYGGAGNGSNRGKFMPPSKLNYGFKPTKKKAAKGKSNSGKGSSAGRGYSSRFKKSEGSRKPAAAGAQISKTPTASSAKGGSYSFINKISAFLEPFTSLFR